MSIDQEPAVQDETGAGALWLPSALPDDLDVPPRVNAFQFSLLWARTAPEEWRYRPRRPYLFLARETRYADAFRDVEAAPEPQPVREGGRALMVPWKAHEGFWERYAPDHEAGRRAHLAWRWSLPLLADRVADFEFGAGRFSFTRCEAYVYPHGLALAVHFGERKCDWTLDALASHARTLRYSRCRWRTREQAVDQIASATLDELGAEIWGADCRLHAGAAEPFTVFTVTKARGTRWNEPVAEGGRVHRFLDRVAGWTTRDRGPDELAKARVSSPRKDGHILYAHRRSRCVWFPEHYETKDTRFSLSNYHRNLTICSMQTESLGQYLCRADDDLARHGYLSIPQKEYARHALASLDRLRTGTVQETYRSRSPQRQMDDNDVVPSMERVRTYLRAL